MENHAGAALRRSAAALLLAIAAALLACGAEDSQSCAGCKINGEFYDPCPSYPQAYCAYNQPCTVVTNVCK